MASSSKSNPPEPKQEWKGEQETRNWLELPSDVMANILCRLGAINILASAQKVCTAWRKISKDPAMWRVIHMDNCWDRNARPPRLYARREFCRKMFKNAVDRSQGQLVSITIVGFGDAQLLHYVADRSSQLRCLQIACCYGNTHECLTEILKKFPLLEELSLHITSISEEAIETAGRCCPMLGTLKLNLEAITIWDEKCDDTAIAIGQNLPELKHLELIGNTMTNNGLEVILDGCGQLESLDLRKCFYIDLNGDTGKRCSQQITSLKLPNDSLEDCPYIAFYNVEVERMLLESEYNDRLTSLDFEDFTGNDD